MSGARIRCFTTASPPPSPPVTETPTTGSLDDGSILSSSTEGNSSGAGGSSRRRSPSQHHRSSSDRLTVLQADPLVWQDVNGALHPLVGLDFEHERDMLTQALANAKIDIELVFDIATTDRLGSYLAEGEGSALHFSGHGHPQYLVIENDRGAMQPLMVEHLKKWIRAGASGGNFLQFVFVSACHSRTAGEAFVEAGVPHVVCCQHDNHTIRDVVAAVFAKAFYRAAANGLNLSRAFELAKHQVMECPNLTASERQSQVERFVLLPETGTNHDVPIFHQETAMAATTSTLPPPRRLLTCPLTNNYLSPSSASSSRDFWVDESVIPLPPQGFEGRRTDAYRLLEALKEARLVRVTGIEGIGKTSVVSFACHYMLMRKKDIFPYQILWVSSSTHSLSSAKTKTASTTNTTGDYSNQILALFEKAMRHLASSSSDHPTTFFDELETSDELRYCCNSINSQLRNEKCILVIDPKKSLVDWKRPLLRADTPAMMSRLQSFLAFLFVHTRHLKVILIQHDADASAATARSPTTASSTATSQNKSRQQHAISNCHVIEKEIVVGRLGFSSTAALFSRLCPYVTERRYSLVADAKDLQVLLAGDDDDDDDDDEDPLSQELMSAKQRSIYKMIGEGVPQRISMAAKQMTGKDYDRLITLARQEEAEMAVVTSRIELDRKLEVLSRTIDGAVAEQRFLEAHSLQQDRRELELMKDSLPSLETLKSLAEIVEKDLKTAIEDEDFLAANYLHQQLDIFHGKIRIEQKAHEDLGIDLSSSAPTVAEVRSIQGTQRMSGAEDPQSENRNDALAQTSSSDRGRVRKGIHIASARVRLGVCVVIAAIAGVMFMGVMIPTCSRTDESVFATHFHKNGFAWCDVLPLLKIRLSQRQQEPLTMSPAGDIVFDHPVESSSWYFHDDVPGNPAKDHHRKGLHRPSKAATLREHREKPTSPQGADLRLAEDGQPCDTHNHCLNGVCGLTSLYVDNAALNDDVESICCPSGQAITLDRAKLRGHGFHSTPSSSHPSSWRSYCTESIPVGELCASSDELCTSGKCLKESGRCAADVNEPCKSSADCGNGRCAYSSYHGGAGGATTSATATTSLICCPSGDSVAIFEMDANGMVSPTRTSLGEFCTEILPPGSPCGHDPDSSDLLCQSGECRTYDDGICK